MSFTLCNRHHILKIIVISSQNSLLVCYKLLQESKFSSETVTNLIQRYYMIIYEVKIVSYVIVRLTKVYLGRLSRVLVSRQLIISLPITSTYTEFFVLKFESILQSIRICINVIEFLER